MPRNGQTGEGAVPGRGYLPRQAGHGRLRIPRIGYEVTAMANQVANREIQINRRLLAGGGALIGIGGLLGFAGVLLAGSAVVSFTRQRARQLERPPAEIAKLKWQQAKAATSAGAKAWQVGPPAEARSAGK